MKREVRQRCGFGCVICGDPFYQIDHMVEYAVVQDHQTDNLTLLCDKHHADKTCGRLALETVVRENSNPINRREGANLPSRMLMFEGDSPKVELGRNWFTSPTETLIALAIDNFPLITFRIEHNALLLTLIILDGNNDPVIQIVDNELAFSTEAWDVETVGPSVTVRRAERKIALSLQLDPPSAIRVTRAEFFRNGIFVDVGPSGVTVGGKQNLHMLGSSYNCEVGYAFGRRNKYPNVGFKYPNPPRLPHPSL